MYLLLNVCLLFFFFFLLNFLSQALEIPQTKICDASNTGWQIYSLFDKVYTLMHNNKSLYYFLTRCISLMAQ